MPQDNDQPNMPKRTKSHWLESRSKAVLESLITQSDLFLARLGIPDDYGVDGTLEALIDTDYASNVLVSCQLKATEDDLNTDGSLSIPVSVSNLQYLSSQRYSLYIGYHHPTETLFVREANSVISEASRSKKEWQKQSTITVRFDQKLDEEYLVALNRKALASANLFKSNRLAILEASDDSLIEILRNFKTALPIPEQKDHALEMLKTLRDEQKDQLISDNFDAFNAVLKGDPNAIQYLLFAEIDLARAGMPYSRARIESADDFLCNILENDLGAPEITLYNMGNVCSVKGELDRSVACYEKAIELLDVKGDVFNKAQALKNAGSSYEELGNDQKAEEYYRNALECVPNLSEANLQLGLLLMKKGDYEGAIEYLDKAVFSRSQAGASIVTYRQITCLFNLGEDNVAFRLIFALTGINDDPSVLEWCSSQVAQFGYGNEETAKNARRFWQKFEEVLAKSDQSEFNLIRCDIKLDSSNKEIDKRIDDAIKVELLSVEQAAFLYDRLGHRQQDRGDWPNAKAYFKRASDLGGQDYTCCLATAQNHLSAFEDAHKLLVSTEDHYESDEVYWFQRGFSAIRLKNFPDAIQSFESAIKFDDEYEKAWFNLCLAHFRNDDFDEALRVATIATSRFPNNELAPQTLEMIVVINEMKVKD